MEEIKKLTPVEREGKRVLTTQQLAESYEADVQQIQQNFNNHQDRFVEGKHYYLLKGNDLKEFKNKYGFLINRYSPKIYLWTLEGSLLHLQIIDENIEKYVDLLSNYFNVEKDKIIIINTPRKEIELKETLEKVFKDICTFIPQYFIDNYKIDFYCPKYNLAIEFDENSHKYHLDKDYVRQKYIEEKLNCIFIRIKEDDNIYYSINKIYKYILNCNFENNINLNILQ